MAKVLVVDDSASMRAAVSHMLRGMNLQAMEADSGERAIALYMEERPSIVLLDVNMPGIDGYETARRIRAAEPDEWVPIIFLSANAPTKRSIAPRNPAAIATSWSEGGFFQPEPFVVSASPRAVEPWTAIDTRMFRSPFDMVLRARSRRTERAVR